MGAWGTGSFENDSALDFISNIFNEKEIVKVIKSSKKRGWHAYDEARVAAATLLHLYKLDTLWCNQSTIDLLKEYIDVAKSDEEWLDSWYDIRDRRDIKKSLSKLSKGLSELEGY
jgi:hypothetical protein